MPCSFAYFCKRRLFLLLSKTKGKPALTLIIEDNNIISGRKVVKRFFKKIFCIKHSFLVRGVFVLHFLKDCGK